MNKQLIASPSNLAFSVANLINVLRSQIMTVWNYDIGQIIIVENGLIFNNNLTIWSYYSPGEFSANKPFVFFGKCSAFAL